MDSVFSTAGLCLELACLLRTPLTDRIASVGFMFVGSYITACVRIAIAVALIL